MIIIGTKSVPEIYATMLISNKRCYIQEMEYSTAVLNEYKLNVLFDDTQPLDVNIQMDDTIVELFKKYQTVKIFETFMDFGNIVYIFNKSEETVLATKLPELSCICDLPEFKFDCEVTLQVDDGTLTCKLDEGVLTHRVTLIHYGKKSNELIINGSYLPVGMCKLYIGEILAIETDKKIMYIAPID